MSLLSEEQWAYLANLEEKAMSRLRDIRVTKIFLPFLFLFFAIALLVDYIALLEIMSHLLAPEPGDPERWNAAIFAMGGMISVGALHAYTLVKPNSWLTRALPNSVSILAPFFLIAASLMVSGIVWSNGVSALTEPSLGDQVKVMIGGVVEEVAPPAIHVFFEENILPVFSVIFAIAMGGIFLLSVFLSHSLLCAIKSSIQNIVITTSDVNPIVTGYGELEELDRDHITVTRELNRRSMSETQEKHETAQIIIAAGLKASRAIDQVITARKIREKPSAADIIFAEHNGIPREVWDWNLDVLEERSEKIKQTLSLDNVLRILDLNRDPGEV